MVAYDNPNAKYQVVKVPETVLDVLDATGEAFVNVGDDYPFDRVRLYKQFEDGPTADSDRGCLVGDMTIERLRYGDAVDYGAGIDSEHHNDSISLVHEDFVVEKEDENKEMVDELFDLHERAEKEDTQRAITRAIRTLGYDVEPSGFELVERDDY